MMQVIQKRGDDALRKIKFVGFREFNSHFPYFGEGDLVVHLPGMDMDKRMRVLKDLLDATRLADGTWVRDLSSESQPVFHDEHQRGMDYSNLGGSAGGVIYQNADDVIKEVYKARSKG